MLERPLFIISRALRNMRQNPVLCGAAIGTIAVSLTIVASFALILFHIQDLARQWSKEIEITVYLDPVPAENELSALLEEIRRRPEVMNVSYTSQPAALARFRARLGNDAGLLDGVKADVLPASLEISLAEEHRSRQGVDALVAALKKKRELADLQYGQEWLERFESFLRLLRTGGLLLGGFLLMATLFIVANTIKLTLYARRDELEVMGLVGATPLFIQLPFVLEGALQGAAGGSLAVTGAYVLHHTLLQQGVEAVLPGAGVGSLSFLPVAHLALVVGLGVLLGAFGSLFSLRQVTRM